MADITLDISNSSMSCYARCPKLYQFEWIERLEPRRFNPALAIGTMVHAGLEAIWSDLSAFGLKEAEQAWAEIHKDHWDCNEFDNAWPVVEQVLRGKTRRFHHSRQVRRHGTLSGRRVGASKHHGFRRCMGVPGRLWPVPDRSIHLNNSGWNMATGLADLRDYFHHRSATVPLPGFTGVYIGGECAPHGGQERVIRRVFDVRRRKR